MLFQLQQMVIAADDVIRSSSIGAFEYPVIGGVRRDDVEPMRGLSALGDTRELPQSFLYLRLRPGEFSPRNVFATSSPMSLEMTS